MSKRGELHTSKMVVANGKRTYFFNVKENYRGELFLSIVESVRSDKDEETYKRQQIIIYNEHLGEFISFFRKAVTHLPPSVGPVQDVLFSPPKNVS